MSTRNLIRNGVTRIGYTNDSMEIVTGVKSLFHEEVLSFTPPTVSTGDVFKIDYFLHQVIND